MVVNSGLQNLAQGMRRNDTAAEYRLWFILRGKKLGVKFRRQQVIARYIVDFYCPELKLVVEADGGQHSPEVDQARDDFLKREGMTVIRFWNNEIIGNPDGVYQAMVDQIAMMKKSFY